MRAASLAPQSSNEAAQRREHIPKTRQGISGKFPFPVLTYCRNSRWEKSNAARREFCLSHHKRVVAEVGNLIKFFKIPPGVAP